MEEIKMSAEELKEFEAFKAQKAKKEAEAKRRETRRQYAEMVDEELQNTIPLLEELSQELSTIKKTIFDNFKTVLSIKKEITTIEEDQRSHTFTSSDNSFRLRLGYYTLDSYRDTVEDGIAMVRRYIESLAKDEESKALVRAILRLLSRDKNGTIKASRVLQLRQMAEDSGNENFLEGVRIIEESYQPRPSKTFIRAEVKDEEGGWRTIPLSLTDAPL